MIIHDDIATLSHADSVTIRPIEPTITAHCALPAQKIVRNLIC